MSDSQDNMYPLQQFVQNKNSVIMIMVEQNLYY